VSIQAQQLVLPQVGDRVRRYELLKELGRGGFGAVYLARQIGLEDYVALKVLLPRDDGSGDKLQVIERFRQEAEVIKRLQHPCALKIRDVGMTEHGLPFLVTEFVRGKELAVVIGRGPLPAARVARIAEQVLGCLGEAHALGVVHRDLKPGNLMLQDIVGEDDLIKVLDFGIAKASNLGAAAVRTQTGVGVGTPHYMSPEQCRGLPDIDGRSDLYSLGLVMAECLTGAKVVQVTDVMQAYYTQARPEPLEFDPRVVRSPLFPVIQVATQKDREARFPDAQAMRTALRQLAAGQPLGHPQGSGPWAVAGPAGVPEAGGGASQPSATGPTPTSGPIPIASASTLAAVTVAPAGEDAEGAGWIRPAIAVFAVLAVLAAVALPIVSARFGDGEESIPAEAPVTPPPPQPAPPGDPGGTAGAERSGVSAAARVVEVGQAVAERQRALADSAAAEAVEAAEAAEAAARAAEAARPVVTVGRVRGDAPRYRVRVTIDVEPVGAEIVDEDGDVVGVSPFDGWVASDDSTVTLTVRSDGYRREEWRVDMRAEQPAVFTRELRARQASRASETPRQTREDAVPEDSADDAEEPPSAGESEGPRVRQVPIY
jgi:hypothetical protein